MLQPPIQATPMSTPAQVFDGPITCSRAKKLQQEVNALLYEIHFNINENYILCRSCCYYSGSSSRMPRIKKEKTTEKDHTRTRPVLQNSLKEAVITFDYQNL